MKFINFTAHDINICDLEGKELLLTVYSSGEARVEAIRTTNTVLSEHLGIPVQHVEYNRLSAAVDFQESNTVYIVSAMYKSWWEDVVGVDFVHYLATRSTYVMSPGPSVVVDGKVVGCRGLTE